ncbi:MAG: hypothetical protein J6A75_02180 [Lachnospiraceae bacterium]|nr:hypothetical protein [Lachnospiraceae bacterium]
MLHTIKEFIQKTKAGEYHWLADSEFNMEIFAYYQKACCQSGWRRVICQEHPEITIQYTAEIYVFINGDIKCRFEDFYIEKKGIEICGKLCSTDEEYEILVQELCVEVEKVFSKEDSLTENKEFYYACIEDDIDALKCMLEGTKSFAYIWKIDTLHNEISFEVENLENRNYIQEDGIRCSDEAYDYSTKVRYEDIDVISAFKCLESKLPEDYKQQLYDAILANMRHHNRLTDSSEKFLELYLLQKTNGGNIYLPNAFAEEIVFE